MQRVLGIMLFFYSFLIFADDTVLKLYRPFGDVVEQVAPIVKNKLIGQCFAQSQLIIREDAWRCQVDNKIFDPCFVKDMGEHQEVLCPQSPWTEDSVQIKVSHFLNNEHHTPLDMSRVFPWAIELANGEHCQAIETNEVYETMPIRYKCSNQNVLMGYLQRCKAVWTMLEKTPQGVVTVELRKAWF